MDENMQRHWLSFSASPADAFTAPVPAWTHTKTNSVDKSYSAVHRRFTTKGLGKRWCTQQQPDNWDFDTNLLHIRCTLIWRHTCKKSRMMISLLGDSVNFALGDVSGMEVLQLALLRMFFHAQTLHFLNHKTVKFQSRIIKLCNFVS